MADSQTDRRAIVKERKKAVLLELTENERKLLSKILLIERENLHLKRPRIKDDLLRAVKEVIK